MNSFREAARMGLYLMDGLWLIVQMSRVMADNNYWHGVIVTAVAVSIIFLAEVAGSHPKHGG